jgi:hypothetical protein
MTTRHYTQAEIEAALKEADGQRNNMIPTVMPRLTEIIRQQQEEIRVHKYDKAEYQRPDGEKRFYKEIRAAHPMQTGDHKLLSRSGFGIRTPLKVQPRTSRKLAADADSKFPAGD